MAPKVQLMTKSNKVLCVIWRGSQKNHGIFENTLRGRSGANFDSDPEILKTVRFLDAVNSFDLSENSQVEIVAFINRKFDISTKHRWSVNICKALKGSLNRNYGQLI